jgi:nucleoside-diphosphate-sugar epimerase
MFSYQNVGLLGSDGFVGQTICKGKNEIKKFNRVNMHELFAEKLNFLIISAVSAEKWRANSDPSADKEKIEILIRFLERIRTNKVVLISTIDVFGPNFEFNEDSSSLKVVPTPYGQNRNFLERRVSEIFKDSSILRLPGLFGPGLKKNLLFDILHNNVITVPSLESTYQYLFAPRIVDLIDEIILSDIKLFHAATEPIKIHELIQIARTSLPPMVKSFQEDKNEKELHYKMKTKYRQSGFLLNSSCVLNEIRDWFKSEKNQIFN